MDPVTQGVLGAAFAQTRGPTQTLAKAAIIGAVAGMAADLDILISSTTDPLLALEFHRHFTHSLLFIPFGGLLCALLLHPLLGRRWRLGFRWTLTWCIIGYATHGLLDGCTTYGTRLLWPLDDTRYAWDIIAVVDPLFSLPLLLLVVLAAVKKSRRWLALAMLWGTFYLTIGFVQHERAVAIGHDLAAGRGHTVVKLEAKPSFGNLALWKVIYESDQRYYVDAVKPGLGATRIWPGASVPKLDIRRDLPWLDPASQQARDIERFRVFSAGYIAADPQDSRRIGDIRYSMLPHRIEPMWGISLAPGAAADAHVAFYTERGNGREAFRQLFAMIFE